MSRILHLTTFLQGGAGRVITALACAQRRQGHDVTVVTSGTGVPGYGNYGTYLQTLVETGVPVHRIDSLFRREHADNLRVVAHLDAAFDGRDIPDVIHTHAAVPTLVALTFVGARRATSAIVQTMHGWGTAKSATQAASDVTVMNLADRVVVPSRHAAAQLIGAGVRAERILRVPYGVADLGETSGVAACVTERIQTARRRGAAIVVCLGTFGERKNQLLLVDAVSGLDASVPVLVLFVGDGDPEPLHARIAHHGLEDRCVVHGYDPEARALAALADLLVLPSRSEGQPLAILEAFADGLLVAASDIPELAELVEDEVTGVTFSSDDPHSLAVAMRRVIAMDAVQRDAIRETARRIQRVEYSEVTMCRRYLDVYNTARAARSIVPAPDRTWRARRAAVAQRPCR